ncbi:unnamed protein product [Arctia plantaginis]|uniref:Uncharacterized protein n=1 Tax=Arctia plantaginis TaxID=874455 RepID=A0A8S1B8A5_ARCPL|nr:unnamed protein product [Arctia plantaginis]CAB3254016.1 unnamed protein product [Arctia plantaginis]
METLKNSSEIYDNDSSSNSTSTPEKINSCTFDNPDIFSVFGDASCGEPFCAQKLQLDFTPDEEIDNEYVQKKCCAFWNFIYSQPEIQNLMVKPQKNVDLQSIGIYGDSVSSMDDETAEIESRDLKERTALSMLEFVEDKGLIDRTFEAKIHESHCTMGSREYKELEKPKKNLKPGPCAPCGGISGPCPCISPEPCALKALVRSMQDWDAKHPKSLEEPSHPPSLQHGILQRQAESTSHSD